ncbi:S1C family serine protease [Rhodococcus triatomae]|nr:trypsin-like peptidase domain-containing protein [Rhodococcus triatomae]
MTDERSRDDHQNPPTEQMPRVPEGQMPRVPEGQMPRVPEGYHQQQQWQPGYPAPGRYAGSPNTSGFGPYPGQLGQPTGGGPGGPGGPGGTLPPPPPAGNAPQGGPARGRTALVAGVVALALVSGGIGGYVGGLASGSGSGAEVTSSLNAPRGEAQPTANAPEGSVQAVAQKVVPSVVQIEVAGPRGGGEGSGVVLSGDGLILTNNHVVGAAADGGELQVAFSDGTKAPATLVGADPVSDLAVVKASGKTDLTPIELGTSANVQVGQQVVAVGSPLGLASTVTEGIVSALNRPVSTSGEAGNQNTVIDALQTDAAINPGNSGGALVNMDGRLVGINTAIATVGGGSTGAQSGSIGLGFAIPVDQASRIANELIETGKATQAIIGVQVPNRDNANGATVVEVTPGSPAERAGIPKGSVITKVDDRTIDSGDSLIATIRSHAPGENVSVTYTDTNGNNPKTVDVTLGTAESQGGR